ncbi:unnamed protein product [Rotaria sordida]|uniref:Uncharacterized protein n=1 Tax=Rotaria sordida TaxID=392033 RepID=A0A815S0T3_9BILA|nr:unnamed protein product [Rotaria sordida]CAF1358719.1 unnamed protein product [Rotaria sordida]CAF1482798.1 unnamed protein product [Rotaria sordida]CAF1482891.1 unnamed protein product [Rotaria sordida]CAF3899479.1 unnamed protein product [Rotaria sordida]
MATIGSNILSQNQVVELRYYGIRVFSSLHDRRKLHVNKSLARLIIFLGLCLIGITAADLSKLSSTITQSEQSIWPSSGKGIWIGLFVIAVGIFTLIAVKEKSHASFHILLPYTIIAILLCFFGLLTSIAILQRYIKHPILSDEINRNKEQEIQFVLSALLIGIFALTFLFLSCLSCMICWTIPHFCDKYQGSMPQPFYRSRPNLPIEIPLQPPRSPIQSIIIQSSRYRRQRPYVVNGADLPS